MSLCEVASDGTVHFRLQGLHQLSFIVQQLPPLSFDKICLPAFCGTQTHSVHKSYALITQRNQLCDTGLLDSMFL